MPPIPPVFSALSKEMAANLGRGSREVRLFAPQTALFPRRMRRGCCGLRPGSPAVENTRSRGRIV